MCLLNDFRMYDPRLYSPEIVLTVHTLHLLVLWALCWYYETLLETVQEAARLVGGPWAERQMIANPVGSKRRREEPFCVIGEYSARDYCFYTKAGAHIAAALVNWTFLKWLILPECAVPSN